MLQESVWISPLSIGEDMREFINSIGLSEYIFVMEVSGFILGDPKQLVRRAWNLEKLEEEHFKLKTKIESINQLIRKENDRISKSEAKTSKAYMEDYLDELLRKKRKVMRDMLEFVANFPPLARELLPRSLQNIFSILTKA